jgi:hypothetical protein
MSMIRRLSMGLALSIGLALLPTPAQALTMQDLLNGQTITVGDKLFSNFGGYQSNGNGTGLSVPASDITVTAISSPLNPGLQYQSADWTVSGVGSQDTTFHYSVTVLNPSLLIHDVSMSLQQGAVGAGNGSNITITESVATGPPPGGTPLTNPALIVDQMNASGSKFFDQQLITNVSSAYVSKDIGLKNTGTDTTVFSVLQQNFSQVAVPEPSTMAIAGLGSLAFIGYGLRRRVKK